MSKEKMNNLFHFLSITEVELRIGGVSENTIQSFFCSTKQQFILVEIIKIGDAWVYTTPTKEIVFAHGSPKKLLKEMILEDISDRLEEFFDQNLAQEK